VSVRLLGLILLSGLGLLAGCEDNEHPFGDTWSVSCTAQDAPALAVAFQRDGHLDDGGRKRSYLGRVRMDLEAGVTHYWIWQVDVNVRDDTAQTVALEPVPIPDDYVDDLKELRLEVDTFFENEETTGATMSGICAWGESTGNLTLQQSDDCDVCDAIECSTLSGAPVLGLAAWGGLLLWRRRRD